MGIFYRQTRDCWMYKFRKNKETYEESGFPTKSAAAKAEREKQNELDRPIQIATGSFLEIANMYLDHCAASLQPNTVRYKNQYFKVFFKAVTNQSVRPESGNTSTQKGRKAPAIPKLPDGMVLRKDVAADKIPPTTFEKFLDIVAVEQGRKISNRYLKDLKALYNWALRSNYVKENPLRHIDQKGEDVYRKYVPPQEDINAVLMAANQEEMDLILTLYGTGARISEVCRLTWGDVNLEKGTITLWTRKRKGGGMQPDSLSMTAKLKEVMEKRWKARDKKSQFVFCKSDGSPYKTKSHFIRYLMSRLCKRAEVKPFGYHAIRHMVASILMDSGKATLSNIQHFLRHNRPTTTENYLKSLNPGSQEMADILDSIDLKKAKAAKDNASTKE